MTCLAAESAELRLHVWVLHDSCKDRNCTAEQVAWADGARVESDLARANEIYTSTRIQLTARTVRVRARGTLLERVIDVGCTDDGQRIRESIGHVAGHINVYYVRDPGAKGLWCAPDSILIGATAYPETLAHEMGHALSLEHVEAESGASDNLMSSTGAMSRLTVEQVERVKRSLERWIEQMKTEATTAASATQGR